MGEGGRCRVDVRVPVSSSTPCTQPCLCLSGFAFLKIKQAQDEERRQLIQLRDILKSALQVDQKEVRAFHFEGWPSCSSVPEPWGPR